METVPLDFMTECLRVTGELIREEKLEKRAVLGHARWYIHIQGTCVVVSKKIPLPCKPLRVPRGTITDFTVEARMNMLRFVNRIDWERNPVPQFVTLTYPDDVYRGGYKQRSQDRFLFCRLVERLIGYHVPTIWRVEWVPRQSGMFVGELFPHWHLLMFTNKVLKEQWVRNRWSGILGIFPRWVSVRVKQVDSGMGAVKYLSKYVTKANHLDIAAYHNSLRKLGRHWGVTRKKLLVMAPVRVSRELTLDEKDCLLAHKNKLLHASDECGQHGFTRLGQKDADEYEEFLN